MSLNDWLETREEIRPGGELQTSRGDELQGLVLDHTWASDRGVGSRLERRGAFGTLIHTSGTALLAALPPANHCPPATCTAAGRARAHGAPRPAVQSRRPGAH
eukprot:237674-Chlamydomonas_euryale.AAC.7